MTDPNEVTCFQSARARASRFCREREWDKFHLPASITLALSGESGEICEIFQWKGTLEAQPGAAHFSEKEMINIGEEIADVFIYSTRLCEVCNIDMAQAARVAEAAFAGAGNFADAASCGQGPPPSFQVRRPQEADWEALGMGELSDIVAQTQSQTFRSQRHVSLCLQAAVGQICALFAARPESQSAPGLDCWSTSEVAQLAWHVGHICVLLACLARFSGHSLGDCVGSKFCKNAKKYPVDLARGSSAKYTAYEESVAQRQQQAYAGVKEVARAAHSKSDTSKPDGTSTGIPTHGYSAWLVVAAAGTGFALGYLSTAPR
ncbi:hypothetical protein B484DRAFT_396496 [Ochromonadaceae sp. CCMP2298]|nr:hypothetical protein B484DRAFT_396496 [Ochromonadaceae sp. CCMP2298]|mmetsp:Transcript_21954/g.48790  ORF Transcript_21954/g.48790 Transcript_21954/m.48790 type:complete len:319 (-) Transcript_21954:30-986(-)|eukprot:CAMPEP_0173310066 /NCGR_PEP_ID=MMETSP1143-20121109/22684_1 /TAXON_ID=483371 /ORGANISM="non described non described, Strain CCMP2298" /LENGTH=318 /DNA_ID=CAMNT_0014251737 /DNA_START=32 /DNA_END=988 /DNA_ORIENTATION=-